MIASQSLENELAKAKITKRTVDAAQNTGAGNLFLWDDELRGFGLKVTPAGTKSFIYQYRMGGREAKTRRWTIGTYGSPWSPSTARTEAARIATLVAQGIDPAETERERRRQAIDLAFDAYSARFATSCAGSGWGRMVERTLRLHAVPILKGKSIVAISRTDISGVLDRLPAEQLALRRNTFAVLRRLFRWAVSRGDLDRSPCEGMETPPAVKARERVLKDDELKRIWLAANDSGRLFGPIVRLLIITGQRREEVTGLNWSELDRDTRTWTLPGERAKNGKANVVPLGDVAISVIDKVAGSQKWPRRGIVFATSGGKAFAMHSKGKARLDKIVAKNGEPDMPPWRLHDLRRTLATGMQRLGVRFEVTEAILNHLSGSRSGVAGVYQRHDWLVEKREALEAWEGHIQNLLGPGVKSTDVR